MTRRQFGRTVAGVSAVCGVGFPSRPDVEGETQPVVPPGRRHRQDTSQTAAFTRLPDGVVSWSFGNETVRKTLALKDGRFFCTSLLNPATGREWIHPEEVSDEFLLQIGPAPEQPQVLSGQGLWEYQDHSFDKRDDFWTVLSIRLKARQLPLLLTRSYLWHQTLPIVREETSVQNNGPAPITIRRLDTLRLRLAPVPGSLELAWMNNYGRGMGMPSNGNPIHKRTVDENVRQDLKTGPYSPDCAWFSLAIPGTREGLLGGWEWSGPMVMSFGDMREPCLIHGGLDPEAMAEELAPGRSLAAPVGWYAFYQGDLDDAAALSHQLVRDSLGPPLPARDYPWVGYCTWSCSMDRDNPFNEKGTHPWFPTQENLLSQVEAAARLGCDLFLWDYGWFPQVGDWWADLKRFPNGPKPVVDAVKGRGMKLGLWFGFGNANETSTVIREHPDWLATYGGKPIPDKFFIRTGASVWKTRIVCLGHRPAREWVKDQLQRVIEEFQIDWLKHDFDLITVCQAQNHTHTAGDGRIAACEGFYEIMDFVRAKYPKVLCENWMNDSAVPDYGVLQRHHMQLIGDAYKAFLLRQMFYGHCQIFPPDRQHRYLRLEDSEGDLTTMLRSGSMGGPWTLLSDPRRLSSEDRGILEREIRFYKQHRHLLARAKVYRLVGRPHPRGWDAFEFYDPERAEGIVYVFRNKHPEVRKHLPLKGLRENSTYRITWVDGKRSMTFSGRQLATAGLLVELTRPGTSEVLLVTRGS